MEQLWQLRMYPSVSSTMDIAADIVKQAKDPATMEPFVVIAEEQTGGRGRFQRLWASPVGNFYATYGFRYDAPLTQLGLYSLVVGVAIVETLRSFEVEAYLKWPNDIFLAGKKVGGILIERKVAEILLVGIGINLKVTPQSPMLKPATSVFEERQKVMAPLAVHQALGKHLNEKIKLFEAGEWLKIRQKWQDYCVHVNQVITIKYLNSGIEREATGLCLGLNDSGSLMLEDAETNQIRSFYTGDVL